MADSLTGREINGYRIGPLLGAGGMGEVYQATTPDNVHVAIKFLKREMFTDIKLQGRFAREIRIMRELNHPNIMPIYDSGIYEDSLYYTMRIINGQTLSGLVHRRKLSPAMYYPILYQLCAALSYGHSENLVHRDLKPDNVFVERNRETNDIHVFLGDFGLGKRSGVDHTLTDADTVLGTPHYMAPEAVLGERLTERADIYALGVMSYEILVGQLPFNESQGHLTAMAHVTKPVPSPSSIVPNFPYRLEEVLAKSLEKNPNDRYATVGEFLAEYEAALHSLSEDEANLVYAQSS